jgi:hypothetical protein
MANSARIHDATVIDADIYDHQEHRCHFIGKFLREHKPPASVLDEIFR